MDRRKQHPLKFEIQKRGISQLDISFAIRVPMSTLNAALNGSRPFDPEVMEAVENYIKDWDRINGTT